MHMPSHLVLLDASLVEAGSVISSNVKNVAGKAVLQVDPASAGAVIKLILISYKAYELLVSETYFIYRLASCFLFAKRVSPTLLGTPETSPNSPILHQSFKWC